MNLAALIRVKFEGDIIEEWVRHTLRFVDRVYVVDNVSVDATAEILRSLVSEGLPLTVWQDAIHESTPDIMTGYVRRVFEEDSPDYVLLVDADGFLKVASRKHLEAALAELPPGADATVRWTTYIPTPQDPDDPRLLARIRHRRADEVPQYSKVVVSRSFMNRPNAEIMLGNHGVSEPGGSEAVELTDAELAYFPVRSIAQLQGNALLVWSSYLIMGYDKDKALGYQWRRLYEELRANPHWSADDLSRRALTYLGEEHGATSLVLAPMPPVERRYVHPVPELNAVSIAYNRQLTAYCCELKNGRTRLLAQIAAARGRKTAFLHIGTHKTGTSAIQAMLGTQYETLAQAGIYVPLPGKNRMHEVLAVHQAAAIRFVEGVEPNLPFEALLEELRRNELPVAVMSSENFEALYRKPDVLEQIATKLGFCGYEARIVMYVRRQSTYVESLYAELVKHGLNRGFDAYLDTVLAEGAANFKYWSFCLEYSHLADSFATVFGAECIDVRPYRPEEGDDFILHDFLTAISGAPTGDIVAQPERVNQSLTFLSVLENLYAHSAHRPVDAPHIMALIEQTLKPNERAFLAKSFKIVEREDEMRIIDRFRKDNERLTKRYGVEVANVAQRRPAHGESPQKRIVRAAEAAWALDGFVPTGADFEAEQDAAWLEEIRSPLPVT